MSHGWREGTLRSTWLSDPDFAPNVWMPIHAPHRCDDHVNTFAIDCQCLSLMNDRAFVTRISMTRRCVVLSCKDTETWPTRQVIIDVGRVNVYLTNEMSSSSRQVRPKHTRWSSSQAPFHDVKTHLMLTWSCKQSTRRRCLYRPLYGNYIRNGIASLKLTRLLRWRK